MFPLRDKVGRTITCEWPSTRKVACLVNTSALSILIRPTNDNLRVARDPPGIGIPQPLFAFPRHSFGEVIQIDMAS
jgi:hypothetical protein